jgi:hypothetical protein
VQSELLTDQKPCLHCASALQHASGIRQKKPPVSHAAAIPSNGAPPQVSSEPEPVLEVLLAVAEVLPDVPELPAALLEVLADDECGFDGAPP